MKYVKTSDRLPDKEGIYFIILKDKQNCFEGKDVIELISDSENRFELSEDTVGIWEEEIEYWLDENEENLITYTCNQAKLNNQVKTIEEIKKHIKVLKQYYLWKNGKVEELNYINFEVNTALEKVIAFAEGQIHTKPVSKFEVFKRFLFFKRKHKK